MSMKIMQNYQYLMQNSNGHEPNFKNLALNSIHYQNCICKHFDGAEFLGKRSEHSNAYAKTAETTVENKHLEIDEGLNRMSESSEVASKRHDTSTLYSNRFENPVSYKKTAPEYSEKNSTNTKEFSDSNICNKIITSDIPVASRSETASMYSGYETAEILAKKQVSRLYGKELGNSGFFMKKNLNLGMFSKMYGSNMYLKHENMNSFAKESSISNLNYTVVGNSELTKRQENGDVYDNRTENSNFHEKDVESSNSFPKKSECSEIQKFSKDVEENDLCAKTESDTNSEDVEMSSYFEEEMQATMARKQLLAHSGTKLNLCDICKKSFSTKGNLLNHHIVHSGTKPHECEVCKKTFSQRSTLGKHYLIHTGEKPHICSVCGRGFRQANNLRIHFLTHSGEKPHTCNICDKRFTQKIALQKHILTHTGMKPHECDVCKRCFTTKGNLQKHFLTHTGEKPHICNICNRGFSQKIALKKHHLTHTGEKPHTCNICGKGFTTKGNLKSHFKRHTREKTSLSSIVKQSIVPSSIAHSLLVPKSIAQSIMSPHLLENKERLSVPSAGSDSPLSNNAGAVSQTKSTHIKHPLTQTNHSSSLPSTSISSMAKSFSQPKSLLKSYYTVPNQYYSTSPLSSHALSSIQFTQPKNLTVPSSQIQVFRSPTFSILSPHPVTSSSNLSNHNIPSSSYIYQTSQSVNSFPSNAHKHAFISQSLQRSQPSVSISREEPLTVNDPDSLSLQITNVKSVASVPTSCPASVNQNISRENTVQNVTMSAVQSHNVPISHSQNLNVLSSPATDDKEHTKLITIL